MDGIDMNSLGGIFKKLGPSIPEKILSTLLAILFIYFIKYISSKILFSQIEDNTTRYRWQKVISFTSGFLALILVGGVWLEGIESLATFLGLLSAGLAFALKDPVSDLAGWGFILWRRPFELGDRIEVGPHKGDVVDIGLFQFTLLEIGNWVDAEQSTGRIIHVPNSKSFNEYQINYTKGFYYIWNEVPVLITFESNWRKAKEILIELLKKEKYLLTRHAERSLRESSQKYMINYSRLTPHVYLSVKDSGILLTIRYLCEPRGRRASEMEIWEEILDRFEENHIELAYPTQRIYRPEDIATKNGAN